MKTSIRARNLEKVLWLLRISCDSDSSSEEYFTGKGDSVLYYASEGNSLNAKCLFAYKIISYIYIYIYIHVLLGLSALLVLLFQHVSAESHSPLQGATKFEDWYSLLCRVSFTNGKMFVHISVVHKYTVCLKSY
jgi:hypothetical protein